MAKVEDKNGFWFIEKNPITKVGVFPYKGNQISADCDPNRIYWVLRPKEELFKKDTLDSLRLIPLVDEHTMIGKDFTAPEEKGIDGTLGDNVTHDTDTIYNDLKIVSNKMKDEIRNGKKELSLGYFCRYDKQPGTYKGQRYDYVQRDIKANHLALVDKGRMGSDVRVYDSKEGGTFAMDSIDITMDKDEDIDWITVRGTHIPIKKGENKSEAVKKFFEGKKGGESKGESESGAEIAEMKEELKRIKKMRGVAKEYHQNTENIDKRIQELEGILKNKNKKSESGVNKEKIQNAINKRGIGGVSSHGNINNVGFNIEEKNGETRIIIKNRGKQYDDRLAELLSEELGMKVTRAPEEDDFLETVYKVSKEGNGEKEKIEELKKEGESESEEEKKFNENFKKIRQLQKELMAEQYKRITGKADENKIEQIEKELEKINKDNNKLVDNYKQKKQSEPEQAGKKTESQEEKLNSSQKMSARQYYKKEFKSDKSMHNSVSEKSIHELYEDLRAGKFDYQDYGDDSIVRERIFDAISRIEGIDYEDVYQMWLKNGEKGAKSKGYEFSQKYVQKHKNKAEDSAEYKTIQGEDTMAEKEKTVAIDEDKRKLIDEIGGILKDKVSEEDWRTIVGKIEKIAYNGSEAGKGTDEAEEEVEESEEKEEVTDKKAAKDKCGKDEDKQDGEKKEGEDEDDKKEDDDEEEKSKVIKAFAKKEKLAKEVEDALGTFDHSEMTELEIARYACDKLELEVEKGQEISAIRGYLKGVGSKPKVSVGYRFGMDSGIQQEEDAEYAKFMKGEK